MCFWSNAGFSKFTFNLNLNFHMHTSVNEWRKHSNIVTYHIISCHMKCFITNVSTHLSCPAVSHNCSKTGSPSTISVFIWKSTPEHMQNQPELLPTSTYKLCNKLAKWLVTSQFGWHMTTKLWKSLIPHSSVTMKISDGCSWPWKFLIYFHFVWDKSYSD